VAAGWKLAAFTTAQIRGPGAVTGQLKGFDAGCGALVTVIERLP
jgi:hypothetical protein